MKKEIMCSDCGCYFAVSLGAMKKMKSKGLNIPTHCPVCREIRWKEERQNKKRARKFERNNDNERF